MYIVVGCNAVNILLNYMLINGAWGAPELGALGAGVATTISRILQAVAIFVVFLSLSKFRQYINGFKLRALELRDSIKLIRLGLPISSQLFFESSAFVISSIIMGLLGTNAIGANQIGITLMNCAFMMVLSIGSSTTIRTSHCYGTRNTEQLRIATNAAYHLAFVWNAITVVLFISLQSVLPRLFTSNVEMIELASLLLIFIALFQIPDGQQCISIGVLRGMQDVKIILPISFIAYWVLNIPVGCLCAFTLGMGAKGLYIGFIVGLSTAMILLGRRVRKFQKRLTLNDF